MTRRRCRTRNTEYALEGDVCVAVHDLRTGLPIAGHGAVGQRLRGCLTLVEGAAPVRAVGPVRAGVCLWFRAAGHDVLTTPVVDVRS